jgi:SAM-dependent methyltransferase
VSEPKAQFDAYKDTYRSEVEKAISFVGGDLPFFTQAKARVLLELADDELGGANAVKALDVGCGPGETDAYLVGKLGELHGVDISEGVLEAARERNPGVTYTLYDGARLPIADGEFDLVFAICVVHHVPPARWRDFVTELARPVRPGGLLAVIEHNPLNPLTRLAVARCEFDEDAVLLRRHETERLQREAGLQPTASRYITFFPWRSSALAAVERRLGRVPLGAQYVAAARRPG